MSVESTISTRYIYTVFISLQTQAPVGGPSYVDIPNMSRYRHLLPQLGFRESPIQGDRSGNGRNGK